MKNPYNLLCAGAILVIASVSVFLRLPYLDKVPSGPDRTAEYTVAVTVRMVQEWLDTGFDWWPPPVVYHIGPGPEVPTNFFRYREIAYSPLFALLAWFPARIIGHTSFAQVQALGIAVHVGVILCVSALAWAMAAQYRRGGVPAFCAILAAAYVAFMPGPMYFYFVSYFADIPVAVLLAAAILAEYLRDLGRETGNARLRSVASIACGLLMFLGVLTEWIFVPYTFLLFIKRSHLEARGCFLWERFILIWKWGWPGALALFLIFSYVTVWHGWGELFVKLVNHAGVGNAGPFQEFIEIFWLSHFPEAFGPTALPLLLCAILATVAAAWRLLRYKQQHPYVRVEFAAATLWILALALGTCLLDSFLLSAHFVENAYHAPIFAIPLALGIVLLPLIFSMPPASDSGFDCHRNGTAGLLLSLGIVAVALGAAYLSRPYPLFHLIDDLPRRKVAQMKGASFVGDVLFSTQLTQVADCINWAPLLGRNIYPAFLLGQAIPRLAKGEPALFDVNDPVYLKAVADGWVRDQRYTMPDPLMIGLVVLHGESLPPGYERVAQEAQLLRVGDYDNYVIDVMRLAELMPPPPWKLRQMEQQRLQQQAPSSDAPAVPAPAAEGL